MGEDFNQDAKLCLHYLIATWWPSSLHLLANNWKRFIVVYSTIVYESTSIT